MQTRPHIIRDDEDNERFIELLKTLVNQDHLTPEQEELVGVLMLLIHDYEKRFVIVPGATQAEIVRHLMKANNLAAKGCFLLTKGVQTSKILHRLSDTLTRSRTGSTPRRDNTNTKSVV